MSSQAPSDRGKTIIRTSLIGIGGNVLLAAFKAVVGILSHSIAITLDAVNNLSDALSSVITIVGTKLAGKAPDKKHPLGHGRVEYITATVISVIVLYAGITSLVESVKKIINPETPSYTVPTLIIVGAAVAVKILLGLYFKRVGKEVSSDSLNASGQDALMDAVISTSTLVAAVIFITTSVSLEAWLGAVISLIIIKAGVDMLRETISKIIGERVDSELSRNIKKTVAEFPDVRGAYDLVLHSYGPDMLMGSLHIEIPDVYTADMIDELTRKIQQKVYKEHHVIITTVGIYSQNTKDDEAASMRSKITELVMGHDDVLQMHGFYVDLVNKNIIFDIIIDFASEDRKALYEHIFNDVRECYPDFDLQITMDADISD